MHWISRIMNYEIVVLRKPAKLFFFLMARSLRPFPSFSVHFFYLKTKLLILCKLYILYYSEMVVKLCSLDRTTKTELPNNSAKKTSRIWTNIYTIFHNNFSQARSRSKYFIYNRNKQKICFLFKLYLFVIKFKGHFCPPKNNLNGRSKGSQYIKATTSWAKKPSNSKLYVVLL